MANMSWRIRHGEYVMANMSWRMCHGEYIMANIFVLSIFSNKTYATFKNMKPNVPGIIRYGIRIETILGRFSNFLEKRQCFVMPFCLWKKYRQKLVKILWKYWKNLKKHIEKISGKTLIPISKPLRFSPDLTIVRHYWIKCIQRKTYTYSVQLN